jgi:hypothetical protein
MGGGYSTSLPGNLAQATSMVSVNPTVPNAKIIFSNFLYPQTVPEGALNYALLTAPTITTNIQFFIGSNGNLSDPGNPDAGASIVYNFMSDQITFNSVYYYNIGAPPWPTWVLTAGVVYIKLYPTEIILPDYITVIRNSISSMFLNYITSEIFSLPLVKLTEDFNTMVNSYTYLSSDYVDIYATFSLGGQINVPLGIYGVITTKNNRYPIMWQFGFISDGFSFYLNEWTPESGWIALPGEPGSFPINNYSSSLNNYQIPLPNTIS